MGTNLLSKLPSYKWKVSFMEPGIKDPNKPTGFKGFMFDAATDFLGSISSEIREGKVALHPLTVQSITLPSIDTDVDTILYKGTQRKRPQSNTYTQLTLSFYEMGDGEVSQALAAWRRLIYNENTNTFGLPKEYEADIIVQLTTSFNVVHTTFLMKKCWPITIEPIQLSHEGGGMPLLIGQSFAVHSMHVNTKGLFEVMMDMDINDFDLPNITSVPRLGGLIF
jgi:hypothetical protein